MEAIAFPALLRQARESAGITQRYLAEATGISAPMIAQLESGKRHPKRRHIEEISRVISDDPLVCDRLLMAADMLPNTIESILESDPLVNRVWQLLHADYPERSRVAIRSWILTGIERAERFVQEVPPSKQNNEGLLRYPVIPGCSECRQPVDVAGTGLAYWCGYCNQEVLNPIPIPVPKEYRGQKSEPD